MPTSRGKTLLEVFFACIFDGGIGRQVNIHEEAPWKLGINSQYLL